MAERLSSPDRFLGGKTAEVARVRAERAGQKARELLDRHSDLVAPHVAELIAQREVADALKKYQEKRLGGYLNDERSEKPGLTVYLTPRGYDAVLEMWQLEGCPMAGKFEEINDRMVALRLPEGVFATGVEFTIGVLIYQEAGKVASESCLHGARYLSVLDYGFVVRIEGDSDELWQNYDYKWDGSPK